MLAQIARCRPGRRRGLPRASWRTPSEVFEEGYTQARPRAVPRLPRAWCASRRSWCGCEAYRSVYRHGVALHPGRAAAPGLQLPLAAGRRQSVRDLVDLHADPLPRARVGRLLPARRHRRAGAGAGAAVRASSAASSGSARRRRDRDARRPRDTGVVAADGGAQRFDLVASNADVVHTYAQLLRGEPRGRGARRQRLRGKRYSMSLFVIYFGTERTLPATSRTTPCCSARATASCSTTSSSAARWPTTSRSTCTRRRSPTRRWRPRAARPSTCCRRCRTSARRRIDWDVEGPRYATASSTTSSSATSRTCAGDLVTCRIFTPLDFSASSNAHLGSAFSLEPVLTQSA